MTGNSIDLYEAAAFYRSAALSGESVTGHEYDEAFAYWDDCDFSDVSPDHHCGPTCADDPDCPVMNLVIKIEKDRLADLNATPLNVLAVDPKSRMIELANRLDRVLRECDGERDDPGTEYGSGGSIDPAPDAKELVTEDELFSEWQLNPAFEATDADRDRLASSLTRRERGL